MSIQTDTQRYWHYQHSCVPCSRGRNCCLVTKTDFLWEEFFSVARSKFMWQRYISCHKNYFLWQDQSSFDKDMFLVTRIDILLQEFIDQPWCYGRTITIQCQTFLSCVNCALKKFFPDRNLVKKHGGTLKIWEGALKTRFRSLPRMITEELSLLFLQTAE